jgi:hypothetical protein
MGVRRPRDGLVCVQPLDILIVRRHRRVELRRKRRKDGGMDGRGEDGAAWGRFDGADARSGFSWCGRGAFGLERAFDGDEPKRVGIGGLGGRAEVVLVPSGGSAVGGWWKGKGRAGGEGRGGAGAEPVGRICGVGEGPWFLWPSGWLDGVGCRALCDAYGGRRGRVEELVGDIAEGGVEGRARVGEWRAEGEQRGRVYGCVGGVLEDVFVVFVDAEAVEVVAKVGLADVLVVGHGGMMCVAWDCQHNRISRVMSGYWSGPRYSRCTYTMVSMMPLARPSICSPSAPSAARSPTDAR